MISNHSIPLQPFYKSLGKWDPEEVFGHPLGLVENQSKEEKPSVPPGPLSPSPTTGFPAERLQKGEMEFINRLLGLSLLILVGSPDIVRRQMPMQAAVCMSVLKLT